ncbi:unnamed protein product, partial [Ectocarpus sp. 8 AP-2014]
TTNDNSNNNKPRPTYPSQLRYRLPDDNIYEYLLGSWKRSLEWREFGPGFQHVRT